ncbi:hypothetical protein NUU61_008880 [Penicillium alfredii]|uniref:PXA domain-containing protein n=1 Tax=Penicillium alfredii TaxID=1506179 RepID=A0A9W9JWU8_9EURO|nr:uncharacterized protein NUU61_008880 [Penicillium alfredii]KAJ5084301.1 hypothetical protein NUU61_008880 [Penicillium alfredii]
MDRSDVSQVAPSQEPVASNSRAPPKDLPSIENDVSHAGVPKELIDSTLDFLSTASNEALLGVFALLATTTYIILGRIGLVLIGVALGIILHASWEGSSRGEAGDKSRSSNPNRRRELALEVSSRLLDWSKRTPSTGVEAEIDSGPLSAPENLTVADLDYATFQPATAAALRTLTDAVVRDYVKYWYEPILPCEPSFPGSCRRILTHFVTSVSSHLSRQRTEDTFLQFLTNSSSIIIVFLNELSAAFATTGTEPVEAQKIVDQFLRQSPDSSLANVLSEAQQRKKLNMIADDILSSFLDSKAYGCSAVRDFLREIFAGVVLESTIISLSRPEFINGWIIYLLQEGESEIMHAIDAGVEGARNQGVSAPKTADSLSNPIQEPTPKADAASKPNENQPGHVDKATEEAIQEAKRLSAMIVSHDVQHLDPEQPFPSDQPNETGSLNVNHSTESPSTLINQNEDPVGQDRRDEAVPVEKSPSLPISPNDESMPTPTPQQDTAVPPVTLHGAQVLVDDVAGGEKGIIKSRPTWDYLLQVEPVVTHSTGWMVFRKYSDFQSLHEMLETVSRLNRIQSFADKYPILPPWKGQTRQDLARELERYLREAMKHESLAETDRMRRFLEKDGGSGEASSTKPGFSFPSQSAFENMGKGVLGALSNAPKGMAGGGRAVFDGVTGVFGGAGASKKQAPAAGRQSRAPSTAENVIHPAPNSADEPTRTGSSKVGNLPAQVSPFRESTLGDLKSETPKSPSAGDSDNRSDLIAGEQDAWASRSTLAPSDDRHSLESSGRNTGLDNPEYCDSSSPSRPSDVDKSSESMHGSRRQGSPITTDETQIAVELIFAVINELYTLSSAWNIRRTLLNAAKSYILRPGSPTLETIRTLLQDSMIEGHTSDNALGEYLTKLRENALPTETELKAWPPPPSEQEKAHLRDTARRLFVQRGIPQAFSTVSK